MIHGLMISVVLTVSMAWLVLVYEYLHTVTGSTIEPIAYFALIGGIMIMFAISERL